MAARCPLILIWSIMFHVGVDRCNIYISYVALSTDDGKMKVHQHQQSLTSTGQTVANVAVLRQQLGSLGSSSMMLVGINNLYVLVSQRRGRGCVARHETRDTRTSGPVTSQYLCRYLLSTRVSRYLLSTRVSRYLLSTTVSRYLLSSRVSM